MLSNSQKEHLTYTAVGQIVTLVAVGIFTFQYTIPGFSEIKAAQQKTQGTLSSYNTILTSGLSINELNGLIKNKPEYAELLKIIQSDSAGATKIIQKPDSVTKDYFDWLKGEIGKTDTEKVELIKEKSKLNSIIPTMSPISNNIEENNITLKQYVSYIEKTILKQFNFDSNVIIGMQGVTFGEKNNKDTPETIGMFEFRLDFKATNDDIIKFIEYVNNSGKPDILTASGNLSKEQIPAAMSNPLITMESFSIQDRLDPNNPTKDNSGRATLKFYVRGLSTSELSYLRENLKLRQKTLEEKINESVTLCKKDGVLCVSRLRLEAFQKKFQEYTRSLANAKIAVSGSDEIYTLMQSSNTLKSLEQELSTILPKQKVSN